MKDDKGARSYVETLRDQTEHYAQNLLRENEKLRALALAVEAENTRLQEEVAAAREIAAEVRVLREGLDAALRERAQLQGRLDETAGELARLRVDRSHVAEQLAAIERESRGIAEQYATAMRQNASLANLYISSHMLHVSLDRGEVLSGISQIIINLVGSEDFAIYEKSGDDDLLRIATSVGESAVSASAPGDATIASLARESRVRLFDRPGHDGLTAFIPLAIGELVTGAIAIFRLLPQKPELQEGDVEIFEMLSAQAAIALYCASLHQKQAGSASTPAVLS